MKRYMSNAFDIADLIIMIDLAVIADSIGIVGANVQPKERIISIVIVWRFKIESSLPNVLSTISRNEPVDGIVEIVRLRLNILVIVLNRWYRTISEVCNVSNWVVGIVKILYDRR